MKDDLHSLENAPTQSDEASSPVEERIAKLEAKLAESASRVRRLVYTLVGAVGLFGAYSVRDVVENAAVSRLDKVMDGIEESEHERIGKIDDSVAQNVKIAEEVASSEHKAALDEYDAAMLKYTSTFEQQKGAIEAEYGESIKNAGAERDTQIAANESDRQAAVAAINAQYDQNAVVIVGDTEQKLAQLKDVNSAQIDALKTQPDTIANDRDSELKTLFDGLRAYEESLATWGQTQKDAILSENGMAKWINSAAAGVLAWFTGAQRYEGLSTIAEMLDCESHSDRAVFVVDCEMGSPQENPDKTALTVVKVMET